MKNDYLTAQFSLEAEQDHDFLKNISLLAVQATQAPIQWDTKKYKDLSASPFLETLLPYITEDFEILKLYVAVRVTDCIRSVHFGGLPSNITENLKKQAFVKITKARNQSDFTKLMNELLAGLSAAYQKYAANTYSPAIQRAVEYIHSQRLQPLSAGDVANQLRMERTNLSKRFHKEVGMTMTDYIHTVKTDLAEEMIHDRSYSLLEISDLLGYSSYNYFCKVYKKYKHCSPSDPY